MNAQDFWQLFMETGAPEMYMLYNKARRLENPYVSDNPGTGASGHGLQ